LSTRETLTLFCLKTNREVIGLIKKTPAITGNSELKWEYYCVYCSGQDNCGEKSANCPYILCQNTNLPN